MSGSAARAPTASRLMVGWVASMDVDGAAASYVAHRDRHARNTTITGRQDASARLSALPPDDWMPVRARIVESLVAATSMSAHRVRKGAVHDNGNEGVFHLLDKTWPRRVQIFGNVRLLEQREQQGPRKDKFQRTIQNKGVRCLVFCCTDRCLGPQNTRDEMDAMRMQQLMESSEALCAPCPGHFPIAQSCHWFFETRSPLPQPGGVVPRRFILRLMKTTDREACTHTPRRTGPTTTCGTAPSVHSFGLTTVTQAPGGRKRKGSTK